MNHDEKRTPDDINRDVKKGVNQNIYSQYKIHILVSMFVTALLLISSLIIILSSLATSWIIFVIACLSILMAIILKKLYKQTHQQEQSSITNIQQKMKKFYPESNK